MACCPRDLSIDANYNFTPIKNEVLETIEYLMRKYPDALSYVEPETKSTVLHLICEHKPPRKLVKEMIKYDENSTKKIDKQGNLPIHIAIDYHADSNVIL